MATELTLPALGQTMEEGTITRWFKAEGDTVQAGEALYEVMTDKVNMEVEASASGILHKILAPADETVPVGGPVAVFLAPGEDAAADGPHPAPAGRPSPAAAGEGGEKTTLTLARATGEGGILMPGEGARSASYVPGEGRTFASPRARRYADEYGVDIALLMGRGTGPEGRIVEADVVAFYEEQQAAAKSLPRVSPLAQKVATAHGVPVAAVSGTGAGGKVTHGDVQRALEPPVPSSPAPPELEVGGPSLAAAGASTIKLTGMRKMVADAVARSAQTAPHVTLTLPVDMSEATRFRQQVLPAIEKTHGVRVSFTDMVAKATARALQDHPNLNSTLAGDTITLHPGVHLGIAVSLGTAGLIVPVVKDAQAKSLGDFSKALKELAAKAKAGALASNDVSGGTFSITNLGTYGVTQFNPIINPPQCAILGVCAIVDTLVPVAGVPAVRPMMNLCLSFDHRITDGAPAAAFLARLREILEQPYLIFT